MGEEYFSLDDHEEKDPDASVQEFLNREDTPYDYKKSSADGAIEHRQKSKDGEVSATSDPDNGDWNHRSEMEVVEEEKRKSISERVENNRHGEALTDPEAGERSDDPADW